MTEFREFRIAVPQSDLHVCSGAADALPLLLVHGCRNTFFAKVR
ncbi:hypothetical protein B0I31_102560 [Saccharothrix carnea]|uniref:Uncharacterized protein n=1 Tax=Saccharothrix carnea TaxID=1280637 RepID=A0A2P8IGJ1_SACCR|nr:epoxide hydrolase N-terminal domain-containing protein [Saccharothrix carnea]PSL57581.1 hypothetical protein B0I31_102560 [Saccharothrix carnea]